MRVNTPLHCVMGQDGKYHAQGTLMTYYNQEARINNLDPMEIGDIDLDIDPSGVFQVVFAGLKQQFTNCTDVTDPVIQQDIPAAAAPASSNTSTTPAPEAAPASSNTSTAPAPEAAPASSNTSTTPAPAAATTA